MAVKPATPSPDPNAKVWRVTKHCHCGDTFTDSSDISHDDANRKALESLKTHSDQKHGPVEG